MKLLFRRFWAWPSELERLGILGMNRRNADFVLPLNPREHYPNVDNKLRTKALCAAHGIPVPMTYAVLRGLRDLSSLEQLLNRHADLVLKPARPNPSEGLRIILEKV
jgi:glutathione synthase/RimK-type ligase-like ATP-grasp enzyme